MEKNEGELTGKVEIKTMKKFLAVDETYMVTEPTPGFKGRTKQSTAIINYIDIGEYKKIIYQAID